MGRSKKITVVDIALLVVAILSLVFAAWQTVQVKKSNENIEALNKQNEMEKESIKDFITRVLNIHDSLDLILKSYDMQKCVDAKQAISAQSEKAKDLHDSMRRYAKAVYSYDPKN